MSPLCEEVKDLLVLIVILDQFTDQLRISNHTLHVGAGLNQRIPPGSYRVHFCLSPRPYKVEGLKVAVDVVLRDSLSFPPI